MCCCAVPCPAVLQLAVLCPAAVPYASVTKIESWPIKEHAGYSVLALHLGSGGSSKYWLYFFPSQYVAGIKIRLIGVQALL